jgi:hypothetical protein
MRIKLAVIAAAAISGIGAGVAIAGEVKGPPTGGAPNTNYNTNATDHANSACVFSGLNDFQNGQTTSQTQTPKDGPPGTPGHGGVPGFENGCRGGSNPDNPPSP